MAINWQRLVNSTQDALLTDSMWVAGIQQTGAKYLRLAGIPVLLEGAGALATTPGSSPLTMRPGKWSGWVGKTRKTAKKSAAACPNPSRKEKGLNEDWRVHP